MSKLKISADTSPVKKSLLELSQEVKKIGGSGAKVSIFSEKDRKFLKGELNKELKLMQNKLKENKAVIADLIKAQQKVEKGSKEELKIRKDIIKAYKTQARLGKSMGEVRGQRKALGGIGGSGGGGGMVSMLGKSVGLLAKAAGGLALGVAGMGLMKGVQASNQFVAGSRNRIRAAGLGIDAGEQGRGSAEQLAAAGLTEQDMIERRANAMATVGKEAGSFESVLQKASFERAYGLEAGQMTNISGSLRANFGGRGAEDAQMKLQASIMASGLEEAIGPYLETATSLLADINENGVTQTDEMINLLSEFTKDGQRTPEQIANAFKNADQAVRGSSGESNAFFQTAFARAGIGGGSIGATRLALSSGGMFGLNQDELAKRGYNKELLGNMGDSGFFTGAGKRSDAILDQFKSSAGMKEGQKIGDVKDLNTMVGLSQMANSAFGTQGMQGFDTLMMLEKVQNKEMSQKEFESKLKDMKEKKSPQVERLEKINNSLAGQTEILRTINSTLMERLGKDTVRAANVLVEGERSAIQGAKNLTGEVLTEENTEKAQGFMGSVRKNLFEGGLGEKLYDWIHGSEEEQAEKMGFKMSKKGNVAGTAGKDNAEAANTPAANEESMAKAVEKGMDRALAKQKAKEAGVNTTINNTIKMPDGKVMNKTHSR